MVSGFWGGKALLLAATRGETRSDRGHRARACAGGSPGRWHKRNFAPAFKRLTERGRRFSLSSPRLGGGGEGWGEEAVFSHRQTASIAIRGTRCLPGPDVCTHRMVFSRRLPFREKESC